MVLIEARGRRWLDVLSRVAEGNTVGVAASIRELDAYRRRLCPGRPSPGNTARCCRSRHADGDVADIAGHTASSNAVGSRGRSIGLHSRAAIREVRRNALVGAALAMLVLLLFLRDVRTTLIISDRDASVDRGDVQPDVLHRVDIERDDARRAGAWCTGMLVDNAIVVLENIFRLRQEGLDAHEAAHREGAAKWPARCMASHADDRSSCSCRSFTCEGVAGLIFKRTGADGHVLAVGLAAGGVAADSHAGERDSWATRTKSCCTRLQRMMPCTRRAAGTRGCCGLALRRAHPVVVLAAIAIAAHRAWELLRTIRAGVPAAHRATARSACAWCCPTGTPIESTRRVVEGILGETERVEQVIDVRFARIGETEGETSTRTEDPDGPNTAELILRVADLGPPDDGGPRRRDSRTSARATWWNCSSRGSMPSRA
jgi:hypothetical protein